MLIKAASHLRPLIRLPSFTSTANTSIPPTSTFTPSTNATTSSSTSSVGGGSFTSNVHLLQSTTPGAGSLTAVGGAASGSGLGNAAGAAPGGGWSGGRSNFNGYSGFGRILTQTPSHSPHSALTSQQSTSDDLEHEHDLEIDGSRPIASDDPKRTNVVEIRRLKSGRPGFRLVQASVPSSPRGTRGRISGVDAGATPGGAIGQLAVVAGGGTRIGSSAEVRLGPRFKIVDLDVDSSGDGIRGENSPFIRDSEEKEVRAERIKRVLRPTTTIVGGAAEGTSPELGAEIESASQSTAASGNRSDSSPVIAGSTVRTDMGTDLEIEIDHPSSIPYTTHRYLLPPSQISSSATDFSDEIEQIVAQSPTWRRKADLSAVGLARTGRGRLEVGVRMTRTGSQVGRKRGTSYVGAETAGMSLGTPFAATPSPQTSRSISTSATIAGTSRLPAVSSPLASHRPIRPRSTSTNGTSRSFTVRKRSKSTSAAAEEQEDASRLTEGEATLLSMKGGVVPAHNVSTGSTELDAATQEMRDALDQADRIAYKSIVRATMENRQDVAERLINQYRNPLSITNPTLAAESNSTPPPYFTVSTYNVILRAMNHFRLPGQPIGDILAAYNELLERDILPNVRTYSEVIVALLARDEEIGVAQDHSKRQKTWIEWDHVAGTLSGKVYADKLALWEKHHAAIESLVQERNFDIAAKLFNSAAVYNRHRSFSTEAYRRLIKGAAKRGEVDTAVAVWTQLESCARIASSSDKKVMIPLDVFQGLIASYGKAGQAEAISELLDEYLIHEKRRLVIYGRDTPDKPYDQTNTVEFVAADKGARNVYVEAIRAYIHGGDLKQAQVLLQKMDRAPAECSNIAGTIPPISSLVFVQSAIAALNSGHFDMAADLIKAYITNPTRMEPVARGEGVSLKDLLDAAIMARDAQSVLLTLQTLGGRVHFPSDQGSLRTARVVRCLSILVPHATEVASSDFGKTLLGVMINLIRADAPGVASGAYSGFTSALTSLATRIDDQQSSDFLTALSKAKEEVEDAASESTFIGDSTTSPDTNTHSTAATSTTDLRHIDPHFSAHVSTALGATPKIPLKDASQLISKEAANGRFASPDVVAELAQAISREAESEPEVRELHRIAQESLELVDPLRRREVWTRLINQILMACCHLGHLEEAGMHRAQLLEEGAIPSSDAYATMIASAKDTTDDASVARELWAESQRLGVVPNLYLYNTIISKLSRARKAESALELFVEMKRRRIRPSSVTYGAVINACSRVGDIESATTLFTEMQSMPNFKPRVPPYNTMMQLHLQTHPTRHLVLHYYNQLIQANVQPTAHTYKLLLDAYGSIQPLDLEAMEVVFRNLCADRKTKVQGTHWASMIYAYGRSAGALQKALELFESIPTHPSSQGKESIEAVVWEAIISVAGQHKAIGKLDDFADRMRKSGAKSTAYVNNMFIKGYAAAGEIDKARAVFDSMADGATGVAAPNNHPTLHTSSGQAKPTTTAETTVVFREPSSYEAMIRAELSVGNKDAARALCDAVEARGYPPAVMSRIRGILADS